MKVELIEAITWDEVFEVITDNPDGVFGLAGPPGIGKTSFAFEIAESMGTTYVGKIQCHDELSPSEIMGVLLPSGQWIPGPGDLAYTHGGMLILDEIDKLSGPCKTYAYGLLDRGPGGTISYLGRTFTQTEGYCSLATMNGSPVDGSLPEAMLDRFDAWFTMTAPTAALLGLLEEPLRKHCIRAYRRARDPFAGPEFTFRQFLSLQRLINTLPLDKAILAACYGQQQLARTVYEALTIGNKEDEE